MSTESPSVNFYIRRVLNVTPAAYAQGHTAARPRRGGVAGARGAPRRGRRAQIEGTHFSPPLSRSAFVVVPRRPIRAPHPRINHHHHQGGQEAAPRRDHGGPRRYDPPRSTADISCAGAKERPPRVKGGPTSSQTASGRDDHPDVGVGPRVVFFSLLARTNNRRREAMLSRLRSADRPRDSPTPPHAARASDRAPCAIGYTVA